ncbi:DUF4412 domain-containing protein [Candidatus Margulisiibacteriota bacterium]
MKNSLLGLLLIGLIALIGCSGGGGKVGMPQEYSAEYISSAGGVEQKIKLNFAKDKWRMEAPGATTIVRKDKNVVWILMHEQKMYMEQKMENQYSMGIAGSSSGGEIKRKKVGSEKVDGIECYLYKVTCKPEDGGAETSTFQWINPKGFPIKMAAEDGSWISMYKNVKPGKQPKALFEIPSGYKKFKMPKF